ncbi:MAG: 1-acyl-sn-glycerol-3-phosphate acyltransferase [Candidatus Obscuribacterales bacterium]|nr:1-acyl-sn-glycerol-3-phosphate acyltransferase [Candidatus Obscuribacterales bacterium]
MSNFISPKPNSQFIAFTKFVVSIVMQIEKLDVRPTARCVTTLRKLAGANAVVLMNHSDRLDPVTAYALSKHSGDEFLYLAAREQFNKHNRWCMRRAGAYSVIRGEEEDLESKEATICLITDNRRKLLMFPEGDVTGRDDEIRPLKEDGLTNIFEAQGRLLLHQEQKSVFILPVVANYEVLDDAIQPLLDTLIMLETKLGLTRFSFSLESRLMRVIAAFLDQIENHYGIDGGIDLAPATRLLRLVKTVALKVAHYNGLDVDDAQSESSILHSVRGCIERLLQSEPSLESEFGEHLDKQARAQARASLTALDLMQQLLIISSTLQQRYFTLESAWRLIDRLEGILTNKTSAKGHRLASIDCGQPIELITLWPSFTRDPDKAVHILDRQVRTAMVDALCQLQERRQLALR